MHIDLPFDEAVALALRGGSLPPMVSALTCEDDTVYATIDLRAVPNAPTALRFAAKLTPSVRAAARYESFADGVLALRVTASAGGLPVQKLLGFAEGLLRTQLQRRGLPSDVVTIESGQGDPRVLLQVQEVANQRVPGITVTKAALAGGRVTVEGEGVPDLKAS
jgi:hypothetical protein